MSLNSRYPCRHTQPRSWCIHDGRVGINTVIHPSSPPLFFNPHDSQGTGLPFSRDRGCSHLCVLSGVFAPLSPGVIGGVRTSVPQTPCGGLGATKVLSSLTHYPSL